MVLLDVRHGLFHDGKELWVHLFEGLLDLFVGHADVPSIHFYLVKTFCIGEKGLIPLRTHRLHDLLDRFLILGIIVGVPFQQALQDILSCPFI